MAIYLNSILVLDSREPCNVRSDFQPAISGEEISASIQAFRQYLRSLYTQLSHVGEGVDTFKKAPHDYENRIPLSVNYTFLHTIKILLMRLHTQCTYDENEGVFRCDKGLFDPKISRVQTCTALVFLQNTGLIFDGVDLAIKSIFMRHNLLVYPTHTTRVC